ncbi:hypothetical protein LA09_03445, partial [Xanthomonas oryzae pv. oryzae]
MLPDLDRIFARIEARFRPLQWIIRATQTTQRHEYLDFAIAQEVNGELPGAFCVIFRDLDDTFLIILVVVIGPADLDLQAWPPGVRHADTASKSTSSPMRLQKTAFIP